MYDNYIWQLHNQGVCFSIWIVIISNSTAKQVQIAGKFEDINFVLNLYQMLTVTAADQNDDVVI